uniref:Homing endonuclease n=1 Tax=uncultured archaeon pHGPA13 TaxID=95173 RepID=Q9UWR3_9ARCH|nr:homing endonuclease [uncultured archaeon pHGPA13]
MNDDVWWLLGVIAGDGYVGKYFVEISDMHKENLEVVADAIRKLGCKPVITKDARERRYRLWVNSKAFADLIKGLGFPIPKPPFNHVAYVQGLYDAEGHVEYWRPKRTVRINFANKNWDIIRLVIETLTSIGVQKPYVRYSSRSYRVQLYRKEDVTPSRRT